MAKRSERHKKPKGDATGIARIPQPNGSALLAGGVPGNRGGGRPPSAIRATARADFDELLPTLKRIVTGRRTKAVDKIRGIDVLGKYGMGSPVSIDDVRQAWREQIDVIREMLPPAQSEPLLAALRPIWTKF